jgi:hypothetical protein
MIPVGKCPKCHEVVSRAQFDQIEIGEMLGGHGGRIYRGFTILCPKCHAILGGGFDPIAIKADTANEILKALGAKRGR